MKWKNYGLWVSIASVLYMVIKDLGFQIDLTEWQTYVTSILGIFVALGVISNPENGKGFFNAKIPPSKTKKVPKNQTGLLNESTDVNNEMNQTVVDYSTTEPTQEITPDRRYPPNEK